MSDVRETFYEGHKSDGTFTKRPMSPHLEIYKPIPSMVLSILNRITGAGMAFGSTIIVAWLVSAARGPQSLKKIQTLTRSIIGQTIIFGFSVSFFLHFIRGIRHLIWDLTCKRLEKNEINQDSKIDITAISILTVILWTLILNKRRHKKPI